MNRVRINKKGEGLPLSTIIVFIIVVVVLVIVLAFFLGGATSITTGIKKIFFGVTAGTDITLAVENCRQYCENAKLLETKEQKQGSAYCKSYFEIDQNNDGEADFTMEGTNKIYKRWYCPSEYASQPIFGGDKLWLNVPCDLGSDGNVQIICTSDIIGPVI